MRYVCGVRRSAKLFVAVLSLVNMCVALVSEVRGATCTRENDCALHPRGRMSSMQTATTPHL
jgi:hypothetical protein